ncbi:MAG: RluA family pseudouridine synthase [Lachnospiraceae bacterium]|nr:RluA family pseudouridine synthase [Lachnospiraceae bacterium]
MKEYTVSDREAGLTLIKYSARVLKEAPNSLLHKFLRNKNIELNGRKADSGSVIQAGDKVLFFLSDETFEKFHGLSEEEGYRSDGFGKCADDKGNQAIRLESDRILYEDEDYLFYDKPAGIRSQSDGSGRLSFNDLLLAYLEYDSEDIIKPSICNRLDTNTSGIVLCGKSAKGLQSLNQAIKSRKVRKYYRGIAAGYIKEDKHLVSFMDNSDSENKVVISDTHKHGYKEVITDVRVIERGRLATYAEFDLITGRKHQIRAQMAHIGHPLIGDMKYGKKLPGLNFARRQMLHAYRVELPDDILMGMTVFAPIPKDMEECMIKTGISV